MPRKFGQSENLGIPDIAFLLLILFLPLRFFGGRTITSVLHHIFMAFLQKMFSSCMSCMTCPRVSCALHVLGRLPSSDRTQQCQILQMIFWPSLVCSCQSAALPWPLSPWAMASVALVGHGTRRCRPGNGKMYSLRITQRVRPDSLQFSRLV